VWSATDGTDQLLLVPGSPNTLQRQTTEWPKQHENKTMMLRADTIIKTLHKFWMACSGSDMMYAAALSFRSQRRISSSYAFGKDFLQIATFY
jgi:hypothetical protein